MRRLADALADLEEAEVRQLVREQIDAGVDALSILDECRSGMDMVGERFRAKEYFLGDLIVSGQIFKDAMAVLEPLLTAKTDPSSRVKVVLGTPKGDIHDIGKNIVATLLKASGFEVVDLGVDVPPERFAEAVVETKASIVGLSGLITPAFESMKIAVDVIKEKGLRDKVKIIIGGGVVNEVAMAYVGADAFSTDAVRGVEICKKFAAEVR